MVILWGGAVSYERGTPVMQVKTADKMEGSAPSGGGCFAYGPHPPTPNPKPQTPNPEPLNINPQP